MYDHEKVQYPRPELPEDGKLPKLQCFFDFADLKSLSKWSAKYYTISEVISAKAKGLNQNITDDEIQILNEALMDVEIKITTAIRNICGQYVRAGGGPSAMGDKNNPDRIFRNASGRETPGDPAVIAEMAAARGQVFKSDD